MKKHNNIIIYSTEKLLHNIIASYQYRLFHVIFMVMIVLNNKQEKTCYCKSHKKHPDPTRKPPSNRAPKIGRPPTHLLAESSQFTSKSRIQDNPLPRLNPAATWKVENLQHPDAKSII